MILCHIHAEEEFEIIEGLAGKGKGRAGNQKGLVSRLDYARVVIGVYFNENGNQGVMGLSRKNVNLLNVHSPCVYIMYDEE